MKEKVIVTVVGKDKVGIISGVTSALSAANVNILDISQTIMQDFFTMIMIGDMAEAKMDLATLKNQLNEEGERLGVQITIQHEDVFHFMHRI